MADKLKENNIQIILIQIHEAHSSAWPTGLAKQPEPHKDFSDRLNRAKEYIETDKPPFPVYVDGFDDEFEQTFRAWPDKFYAIDRNLKVIKKSTYGERGDALVDVDYSTYLLDKIEI